jgi:drug/metabolite transporter (DMT)-like permease
LSSPLAKLLLKDVSPITLAGLLYLGAFLGLFLYSLATNKTTHETKTERLERKDLSWLIGAILSGGVIAPISQMIGLNLISGFSVSLLLNLEGVGAIASTIILREWIGWVMFPALILMVLGVRFIGNEKHEHEHIHRRDDLHHLHKHSNGTREPHIHEHSHDELHHTHAHWPDTQHRYEH